MSSRSLLVAVLVLFSTLAACGKDGDGPPPGDVSTDAESDSSHADVEEPEDAPLDVADTNADLGDGSGDTADTPRDSTDGSGDTDTDEEPEPFERTYSAASSFPAPEGHRWVRSIVHLHSTHSHDACDDQPRLEGGEYNQPCIDSLRRALCDVRIDVAYLTDHPTHMVEVPIEDLLLYDEEVDSLIRDESERPLANRIQCEGGHTVWLRAGAEDSLMPIGLREHVDPDEPTRHEIMNAYTADAVTRMREAGALVWVAHTEGRDAEELRPLGIDGLEIYQLHGNLDPRIREHLLGLDPIGPIAELFPLLAGTSPVPPDLAILAFLEPNEPSLATWAELLIDGPMVGTAGTDAHENTFPGIASDGERLDSYRRMMAWFSNYLLVADELSWETADQTLGAGRVVVVFDVFGDPSGMDFYVARGDDPDARVEVGSTVEFSGEMTIIGEVPQPVGPSGIPATITTLVLRSNGSGWETKAEFGPGPFAYSVTEPGAYRVEVRTTGEHLSPWLAHYTWGERTFPWMYTNAWRIGLDTVE